MSWYKKYKTSQTIYRGDETPVKLEEYDIEYARRQNIKDLGSSYAYGPGIYFASAHDVAQLYGSNVTKKELKNANILNENMSPFPESYIWKIINSVDKDDLETAASNWDEDYQTGLQKIIDLVMNDGDPVEQLFTIWADVFYHQKPTQFVNIMKNNGIDGISKQKDDVTFYVIYNKEILM